MYIVVPATIGAASTPRVVPSENVPKTCSFCTFVLLISVRPLNRVPWKSFAGRTHWPSSANFVAVSPLVVAGPTRAASATRDHPSLCRPCNPRETGSRRPRRRIIAGDPKHIVYVRVVAWVLLTVRQRTYRVGLDPITRPDNGGIATGAVVQELFPDCRGGPGWSGAWRSMDHQYFGGRPAEL